MQRPFSLLLGFSVLPALSGGDLNYYVSSSTGNNANDELTALTPKQTIAAGKALLRNNTGDRLLLLRGDTWTEAFGGFGVSGASARDASCRCAACMAARARLWTGYDGRNT